MYSGVLHTGVFVAWLLRSLSVLFSRYPVLSLPYSLVFLLSCYLVLFSFGYSFASNDPTVHLAAPFVRRSFQRRRRCPCPDACKRYWTRRCVTRLHWARVPGCSVRIRTCVCVCVCASWLVEDGSSPALCRCLFFRFGVSLYAEAASGCLGVVSCVSFRSFSLPSFHLLRLLSLRFAPNCATNISRKNSQPTNFRFYLFLSPFLSISFRLPPFLLLSSLSLSPFSFLLSPFVSLSLHLSLFVSFISFHLRFPASRRPDALILARVPNPAS